MNNELSVQQKTIRDQTEALLDLLPTLKAELYFAGCDEKSRILKRIDQVCSELRRLQELQANKPDTDVYDINNPVHLLKHYEFSASIYHSDEMGHIQVQVLESNQLYALEELLQRIDENKEWDACFLMFESQPRLWLLRFSEHLENTANYHTNCLIEISNLLTDRSDLIALLQNADRWHWDSSNRQAIPVLVKDIEALLHHHYCDELEREIDTSILTMLKDRLDRLFMKITP